MAGATDLVPARYEVAKEQLKIGKSEVFPDNWLVR